MPSTIEQSSVRDLSHAVETLEIALPVAVGDSMDQDEEWVVVRTRSGWRKIRLHDYPEVFSVQGLYEKWVYGVFECRSPRKIADLLVASVQAAGEKPSSLNVLDLGAGNGCVAEELSHKGVRRFVGVDLHGEAAEAAERDRPGLFTDYVVADLSEPTADDRRRLRSAGANCLTCVAALGFGDIPPEVFVEAFNAIETGGWVAFTIKTDFLDESDKSGFSTLIRRMLKDGSLELVQREVYTHRTATDGSDLKYQAFIGRKRADVELP